MKFALLISIVLLAVIPYSSQGPPRALLREAIQQGAKILQDGTSQISQSISQTGEIIQNVGSPTHTITAVVQVILKPMEDLLSKAKNDIISSVDPIKKKTEDDLQKGCDDALQKIKGNQENVTKDTENPNQSECRLILHSLYDIVTGVFKNAINCVSSRVESTYEHLKNISRVRDEARQSVTHLENEKQGCNKKPGLITMVQRTLCSSKIQGEILKITQTTLTEMGSYYFGLSRAIAGLSVSIPSCAIETGYMTVIDGINRLFSGWRGCYEQFMEGGRNLINSVQFPFRICQEADSEDQKGSCPEVTTPGPIDPVPCPKPQESVPGCKTPIPEPIIPTPKEEDESGGNPQGIVQVPFPEE